MMKTVKYLLFALLALTLAAGCGSGHETIPDKELVEIFRDLYLVNAYATSNGISGSVIDSTDIYTPVLDRHGYTVDDLIYTLGTFSKRKSARIADVVALASERIEDEYRILRERVAVLDTVESRAKERFRQVVHTDSLIRIRRIADTAGLRIALPAEWGEYEVAFRYAMDTADGNYRARGSIFVRDRQGTEYGTMRINYRNGESERYRQRVKVPRGGGELVVEPVIYDRNMRQPHFTIDSLVISYLPPRETALDSLSRSLFKNRLFRQLDAYGYHGNQADGHPALLPPQTLSAQDAPSR